MTNKLEQFLEKQINSGNIDWESKSKLIRSSNEQINGHTTKILKKFEHKFNLKKNDVLIKTLLCGYCGTDKKIITFDMSVFSSAFLDSPKHKSKMI